LLISGRNSLSLRRFYLRLRPPFEAPKPTKGANGAFQYQLAALGIKEYRQTLFKLYRVIYRITGNQVIIYLMVDGRRVCSRCWRADCLELKPAVVAPHRLVRLCYPFPLLDPRLHEQDLYPFTDIRLKAA
jgi:hypothetical protein